MNRHIAAVILVVATVTTPATFAQSPKTTVNDAAAKRMLLGSHMLSLQWVSWERFGRVTVADKDGQLTLKGEQRNAKEGSYVTVDGVITVIDKTRFTFTGKIVTRVPYINNGDPCTRDGEFTFAIKASRKYWRLEQMDNPCEPVTDYVDVYFR